MSDNWEESANGTNADLIDPILQKEAKEEVSRQAAEEKELLTVTHSTASAPPAAAEKESNALGPNEEPIPPAQPEVAALSAAAFTPVTVDMTDVDLLSLSDKGEKLYFDDSLGGFKELSKGVLKQLSTENRQRYFLAKGEWDYAQSESDMPDLGELKISARYMKASKRLDVPHRPGYHPYWFRTDEVADKLSEGWAVRTRPTGAEDSISSLTKISARGEDELVLMDLPLVEWERRHILRLEDQKRRSEGHSMQMESEVASVDRNAVYSPEKDNRTRFSAPVDSEGKPVQR